MSSRARKRARAAEAGEVQAPKPPSRSELRNEAVRSDLEPLAPGQRPTAVTVAAIVATLLVVANFALFVAGVDIKGKRPPLSGELVFTALMASMAWGLWRARYWAVLGMQSLLALSMLGAGLSLPLASDLTSALIASVLLIACGALFWFQIKAMARIQMPERR